MRRVRFVLALVLLAWLAWVTVSPQVQAELNWRALHTRGTLRVGIDPGVQPFSFYAADGVALSWSGLDADLAHELATRLQLQLSSDAVGYDSIYDALQTQRVDIALSALSPDPNRTADFSYSQAYFDAGPRLISNTPIRSFSELTHQRVAVSLGGEADRLLRFWERRVPHLQRLPLPNDAAALAALRSGQADAVLVSVFASSAFTSEYKISLSPRPMVIAVRSQDTRLLSEINLALDQMKQDGTLDKLVTNWIK